MSPFVDRKFLVRIRHPFVKATVCIYSLKRLSPTLEQHVVNRKCEENGDWYQFSKLNCALDNLRDLKICTCPHFPGYRSNVCFVRLEYSVISVRFPA